MYSISVQSDGKIIIAGSFTLFNQVARQRIARLNTDGSLDSSYNPGSGSNISGILTTKIQSDGKLIIGGLFSSINGTSRANIARLAADGTLDTSFNPGSGTNGQVNSLDLQPDGKILVGGSFTTYNSINRGRVARINQDGSLDTSLNPGTGADGVVFTVKLQSDGNVLIGGSFNFINGTVRNFVGRLNNDGSLDTTFSNVSSSGSVSTVSIQNDGKIIVGRFEGNGVSVFLQRVSSSGAIDPAFTAWVGVYGQVFSLAVQSDTKIVIAGEFLTVNGVSRTHLARLNADGSVDPGFNPAAVSANTPIRVVSLQPDGKIIIAGDSLTNKIARLNPDGTIDASFNPGTGASDTIYAVKVLNTGQILIGGSFTSFNGTARSRIARLNANGTLDAAFNPTISGATINRIQKIDIDGSGKILISGIFENVNGTTRSKIARLNGDGSLDSAFSATIVGSTLDSGVSTIALQADGKIVIGGLFTTVNGTARNGFARLNSDGSLDSGFNPTLSIEESVRSISLQQDGKIIAAGGFGAIIDGAFRRSILRFLPDGTVDSTFNPGNGTDSSIYATALQADGKIIIGGTFTSANAIQKTGIARLLGDNTPVCSYSINPTSATISAPGQSGSFSVTTSAGCAWTAVSNVGWITTTSSGTGSGTVNFIVSANAGAARSGTITVGGQTFTVNQDSGTPACTYSINPLNTNVPAAGINSSFTISSQTGCGWTALSNNAEWLITSSTGTGSGTVSYSATANTGAARSGTITVGGQTFTVNQAAGNETCLPIPSGLIASYRAEGNANDALGRNNGTLQNGATFTSGVRGQAFSFDGVDDRILIPYSPAFSPAAYTVEAWIKPLALVNDPINQEGIFGQTSGRAQLSVRGGTSGVIPVLSYRAVNGTFQVVVANAEIPLQTFSHVAGTFDGTTLRLYINGVLNAQLATTQPVGDSTCNFWIGGFGDQASGNGFNGAVPQQFSNTAIDELNYYGRALSASEIANLFNGRNSQLCSLSARTPFDFDGDGKTDIGIFRPADGSWWYSRSSDNAFRVFSLGLGSDIIAPGDFTGDGKTDLAVFRPSNGFWFIQRSEDNSFFSFPFGAAGDVPAPADYDNDGKTDAAVFRPASGTWYILNSGGGGTSIIGFGASGDKPVPADFDGDERADIAIFRPSDGSWWYLRSSDLQFRVFRFGLGTDKPVQGDYTGDRRADIAVWRPSTGEWFFQRSEDNSYYSLPFGANGDIPTPGDYDGDGKFDTAVFRPSTAHWFVQRSTAGILITSFGASGDRPIPNAFVP